MTATETRQIVSNPTQNRYGISRRSDLPPVVSERIRTAQYAALETAISGSEGRIALVQFLRAEQKKRDDAAEREWKGYRLVRPEGRLWWTHIQTPFGDRYECKTTTNGYKRFIGCPDQDFCDLVNWLAAANGIALRLETKHAMISHIRERMAFAGMLRWTQGGEA